MCTDTSVDSEALARVRFPRPQSQHGGNIHGMRPSNKSRSRNKPSGNGNHQNNSNQRQRMGNIVNRVFESTGPDGKVRGTPQQIIDKYQALARDAQVSGDRVAAESYLQHSEHYSRLLVEAQRQQLEVRQQERDDNQPRGSEEGGGFDRDRDRRPQPSSNQPSASGLTTFDADEGDYPGGPIETPEDRRSRREEPAPVVPLVPVEAAPVDLQPAFLLQPLVEPMPAVASQAEGEDGEAPAAPPKRTRTRRRPKAEAPVEPAGEAPMAEAMPEAE
jgi:Domain of unknown function (DUF4167)